MMKKTTRNLVVPMFTLALLALSCLPALAKPLMEISMSATKEVVEVVNGRKVKKQLPVKQANPGDTLTYNLTYSNRGDELARDAVIDNPIPAGVTYIANSASGAGSEITFSTDNGKTFAQPVMLTYEYTKGKEVVKRSATPEDYTHIRWTIKEVPAGRSGNLKFMVKVK